MKGKRVLICPACQHPIDSQGNCACPVVMPPAFGLSDYLGSFTPVGEYGPGYHLHVHPDTNEFVVTNPDNQVVIRMPQPGRGCNSIANRILDSRIRAMVEYANRAYFQEEEEERESFWVWLKSFFQR